MAVAAAIMTHFVGNVEFLYAFFRKNLVMINTNIQLNVQHTLARWVSSMTACSL